MRSTTRALLLSACLVALCGCASELHEPHRFRTDGAIFSYEGAFEQSVDQDPATAGCGVFNYSGTTSGYLLVDSENQWIHLEGYGCRVTVEEDSNGVLAATGAPCEFLGAIDARAIGIQTITLENLELNRDAGTFAALLRLVREGDETPQAYCTRLEADLASADDANGNNDAGP